MKPKTEIVLISADKLMAQPDEPLEWLVQGLIPMNTITVIAGDPGNYKSWLSLEIAKSVANGCSLFGKFAVKQQKVIIVDRENRSGHVRLRLKQNATPSGSEIHFVCNEMFRLDNEADYEGLLKKIEETGTGLVIFDSLVRIHSGDENSAKDMSSLLERFHVMTRKGINVIFLHHLKKNSSMGKSHEGLRGSSDIHAAVDCHLRIEHLGEKPLIKIEQNKLRQDEAMKPFLVEVRKTSLVEKGVEFVYVEAYDKNKEERDVAKPAILDLYEKGPDGELPLRKITELLKEESFRKGIVEEALKELVSEDELVITKGKHNTFLYSLKKSSTEEPSVENQG